MKNLVKAGLAGVGLLPVLAIAGEPLFYKDVVMLAQGKDYASVQQYRNAFHNTRVEDGLRANTKAWASKQFDVTLPSGESISINTNKRYKTSTAEVVVGQASGGQQALQRNGVGTESVFVNNDGLITGTIRHAGKRYNVRSLESGQHLVIEVDESRMPADHPEADYAAIFEEAVNRQLAPVQTNNVTAAANTTIDLLVNYTPRAKNAVSNISGLIDLAVAETNTGYSNSGVGITARVVHRAQTSYTESGNMTTDRDRYASKTDSYMNEIHTQRDTYKADVAVLILNDSASCGIAKAIGATASTAFAVVHYDCATGYYSFAHEIGHLQSARHDPAADPTTTPYAYGHGYRSPTSAWRTIMAYNCTSGCPRINYWSNPLKTYGGQAMGTATKSDNTRVLNNTKATIASFR